jgi:hypothetical protein
LKGNEQFPKSRGPGHPSLGENEGGTGTAKDLRPLSLLEQVPLASEHLHSSVDKLQLTSNILLR